MVSKKRLKNKKNAKFVKVSKEEYVREISGKVRDRLNRQKDYLKVFLAANYKRAQLEVIKKQLEDNEKYQLPITLKWQGVPYPYSVLSAEFNIHIFEYKELLSKHEYLKQALKNDGLSDDDIVKVEKGLYKKDEDDLKKVESLLNNPESELFANYTIPAEKPDEKPQTNE